jgi:hypothetical protein
MFGGYRLSLICAGNDPGHNFDEIWKKKLRRRTRQSKMNDPISLTVVYGPVPLHFDLVGCKSGSLYSAWMGSDVFNIEMIQRQR